MTTANSKPDSLTPAEKLQRVLNKAPIRAWAEGYFDLIAMVYELMMSDETDPRLVVSIPSEKAHVYVTINNLYVLQSVLPTKGSDFPGGAGIILSDGFPGEMNDDEIEMDSWQFQPRGDEIEAPWLVRFEVFQFAKDQRIVDEWRRIMIAQLQFGGRSANRKFHEPLLLEIARNLELRGKFFDGISWTSTSS